MNHVNKLWNNHFSGLNSTTTQLSTNEWRLKLIKIYLQSELLSPQKIPQQGRNTERRKIIHLSPSLEKTSKNKKRPKSTNAKSEIKNLTQKRKCSAKKVKSGQKATDCSPRWRSCAKRIRRHGDEFSVCEHARCSPREWRECGKQRVGLSVYVCACALCRCVCTHTTVAHPIECRSGECAKASWEWRWGSCAGPNPGDGQTMCFINSLFLGLQALSLVLALFTRPGWWMCFVHSQSHGWTTFGSVCRSDRVQIDWLRPSNGCILNAVYERWRFVRVSSTMRPQFVHDSSVIRRWTDGWVSDEPGVSCVWAGECSLCQCGICGGWQSSFFHPFDHKWWLLDEGLSLESCVRAGECRVMMILVSLHGEL